MKLLGELIFYTLLILLPVNLGWHFFSNSAYIHGVLVDYYLPTLYLTDILIIVLLGTWVVEILPRTRLLSVDLESIIYNLKTKIYNLKFESSSTLSLYIFIALFLFLVWAGLSILWAPLKDVALYRYARLLEGALLAFWVGTHVNLRRDFDKISRALFFGLFYESALAIFQYLKGGSLFGYYFLGEQPFNSLTPGIAKTGFLGEVRVRAYGTFTHPNVLGGYLAWLLPWLAWRLADKRLRLGELAAFFLALTALFFTFARAAWLAAAAGLISLGWLFRQEHRRLAGKVWLGLAGGFFLLLGFYFSGAANDPFSLTRRAELNSLAVRLVQQSPWRGMGWGNFMVRLEDFGRVSGWTRFLQPVHNIYLLVAAETGVIGLFFFGAFLLSLLVFLRRRRRQEIGLRSEMTGPAAATLQLLLRQSGRENFHLTGRLWVMLLQILGLGLADHYFLTLPQGSLLFWLTVGLVFSLASS